MKRFPNIKKYILKESPAIIIRKNKINLMFFFNGVFLIFRIIRYKHPEAIKIRQRIVYIEEATVANFHSGQTKRKERSTQKRVMSKILKNCDEFLLFCFI